MLRVRRRHASAAIAIALLGLLSLVFFSHASQSSPAPHCPICLVEQSGCLVSPIDRQLVPPSPRELGLVAEVLWLGEAASTHRATPARGPPVLADA